MRGYLLMGTRATDGGGRKNHGKPASPPTELGANKTSYASAKIGVDHHEGSIRGIARVFRVSTFFIVRLLQRRRVAGTLAPGPHGAARPWPSGRSTWNASPGWSREQPDATLEQLRRGAASHVA
jgi:hypothetical protein